MLERVQTDGKPPCTAGGDGNQNHLLENSMEVLSNVRHTGTEHRSGENHNFMTPAGQWSGTVGTTAKTWKQPKEARAHEWIQQMGDADNAMQMARPW